MNLRGVKESGALFALPTYGFIACVLTVIGIGTFRALTGTDAELMAHIERTVPTLSTTGKLAGIWLFARAYSAGCTALTGVEALSDGVAAFKDPAPVNAVRTMRLMVLILGTMFLGITFFANRYGLTYFSGSHETLLSSLIRTVVGDTRGRAASSGWWPKASRRRCSC